MVVGSLLRLGFLWFRILERNERRNALVTNKQQNAETHPPAEAGQVPMIYSRASKKYNSSCVCGLSIPLIILGIVCFAVQIADFFFISKVKYFGAGTWGGLLFILTGSYGVISSKKPIKRTIVTFMVLCIVSSVLGIVPFALGAAGMGVGIERGDDYGYGYYHGYETRYDDTSFFLNGMMMVASLLSCILMIVSSVCACKAVCCQENPGVMAGQVQRVVGPNGETQVIIVPEDQDMAPYNFVPSTFNPSGYIHPGPLAGSAPPAMFHHPAYEEQASLSEYETKKPMEVAYATAI